MSQKVSPSTISPTRLEVISLLLLACRFRVTEWQSRTNQCFKILLGNEQLSIVRSDYFHIIDDDSIRSNEVWITLLFTVEKCTLYSGRLISRLQRDFIN